MTTQDGTRLDADLWRPDAPGRFPVLLMRQPYGRRIASTIVYAHPAWYAEHGYIVVVQDVRGTGSSEGRFRLFLDEEADGAESVRWAAGLPGSSGRIGMYGFSYQAVTQYLALAGGAELHAMAPAMSGWDMRSDWAWEGGAFSQAAGLGWAAQMGWIKARHNGNSAAAAALQAIARAPPLQTAARAMPAAMLEHADLHHYLDWIIHPEPGPYWDGFAPQSRLAGKAVEVPMLHIGGWYDQMLMGTLAGHAAIAAQSAAEQRLVIGPWAHQPWGRRVGAVDFGPGASSPIDTLQLAFFDRHLKGIGDPAPAARLFDLGARTWNDFPAWPPAERRVLYLSGDGLAAATTTGGTLAESPAEDGAERFVHDPWRPVSTCGGHVGQPGGMRDRAAIDDRADVACFTSVPLDAPITICGEVHATLCVGSDQASFDLSATLAMVDPAGRCWNITQGHARLEGDGVRHIAMRATMATVAPGWSLRLSLAGANFPAFPVNPGTGQPPSTTTADDEAIIVITLRHGGPNPSWLSLPTALKPPPPNAAPLPTQRRPAASGSFRS